MKNKKDIGEFDMKKICPDCLSVFVGHASITSCPLAYCEPHNLILVDDLYVDVVQKFLKLFIAFTCVEAGTLEEHNGGPCVCFVDNWLEGTAVTLEMFRDLAVKVDDGTVIVDEIIQRNGYKSMVVKSKYNSADTSPLARLESHVSFVKYL